MATPVDDETAVVDVVASPEFARDDALFAATSKGVFRSEDRAVTWAHLNGDLGHQAMQSVAVARDAAGGSLLFAVTMGGEVWRRNISPAST